MPSTLAHQLYCPRCKTPPLEVTHYEGSKIDICPRCAGLWCEVENWNSKRLGPYADLGSQVDHFPSAQIPDVSALDPNVADFNVVGTVKLNCPNCLQNMTALSIGQPELAEIDQCDRCGGIWLDHLEVDELSALKEWSSARKQINSKLTWGNWWFQLFSQMPIEFNIKPRRFPVVTVSLIIVNVLIFMAQLLLDESLWIELAAQGNEIAFGEDLWAIVTSMFLHGGWLHLFGNMYFLYILGDNVEDVLGRARYLLFYLACGIVATMGYAFLNSSSDIALLGASGAIAGVMAAYLVLFRNSHLTFMFFVWQRKMPVWLWLGGWFLINVLMSLIAFSDAEPTGGIAWIAHVAGFVAGLIFILPQENRLVENHALLKVMRLATA